MIRQLLNFPKVQESTATYALPLRAIGQALELMHIEAFELEKEGNDYVVRGRTKVLPCERLLPQDLSHNLVHLARGNVPSQPSEEKESSTVRPSSVALELRYTPEEIDRLDREGQASRRDSNKMPDGHSMSELLRAAGDYVDQRGARLLGISWRYQSISIVYETAQGRRELDMLSLSSMYDFWLLMSIRKAATAPQAVHYPQKPGDSLLMK